MVVAVLTCPHRSHVCCHSAGVAWPLVLHMQQHDLTTGLQFPYGGRVWAAQAVDTTVLVCIFNSQGCANRAPQLVWPLLVCR